MKKTIMFPTAVILALSLMACGSNNKDDNKKNDANAPVEENENNQNATETDEGMTNDNQNDDLDHNGENRMDLSDEAADKVTELEEVDTATVIVTNQNAYVAVVMNNGDGEAEANTDEEVTKELEGKIADKVREVDDNIENVYVSLNPDFVERMNDYGNRINEGEPVEGFFEEFGEAVRNVFPDAN